VLNAHEYFHRTTELKENMEKILLLLISFIISFQISNGQENEIYIEKEFAKIEQLISKNNFVPGYVYFANDTLGIKLLSFRGKRKMNYYLFCISKDINDSIHFYKPSEIVGYRIDSTDFISYTSDNDSYFIKQLKTGKAYLYERESIPSDKRFLYYLRFSSSPNFYIINPFDNNVIENRLTKSSSSKSTGIATIYYKTKGINEKFKIFITSYFSDCIQVTNRVQSDFYTINDIPRIIETYNNCF